MTLFSMPGVIYYPVFLHAIARSIIKLRDAALIDVVKDFTDFSLLLLIKFFLIIRIHTDKYEFDYC